MAIFCRKKMEPPRTASAALKKARADRQLSLEAVAAQTHIAIKYLEAIENNDCDALPQTKAHCLAYVRSFAAAVGLNPDALTRKFDKEANLENLSAVHPAKHLKIKSGAISMLAKAAVAGAMVLAVLGYLSWQIYGILQPPKLSVHSPAEGMITGQLSIIVKGETQKEIKLTVNGQEIMVSEQGIFEAPVDLSNGLNTINIVATKKHGKTTTVTRHVIVNSLGFRN
ncbi:hypothetical protein EPN28_04795 [Patescibacteria group bacterium]|nr:MAG: hypothetical protein EPN28_04795 [Patescibacteria group bacterium]